MRRPRPTKIVALSIVAVALVTGWWWARDTATVASSDQTPALKISPSQPRRALTVSSAPSLPSNPSEPSAPPSEQRGTRIVRKLPAPRTLEPNDKETTAWIRKAQADLWNDLRKFTKDVNLTDEQWRQFERDLLELGAMDAHGWYVEQDWSGSGVLELTEELDAELTRRTATYMTKQQLRTLDWRHGGLVTRVRHAHYLPTGVELVSDPEY